MRQFEEMAEHRRLAREFSDLLTESEPEGLDDLGWDKQDAYFRGRRVA
ncbi:hypothetical protein ACIA8F_23625 [Streptomyces sp. NPDC051563]